MLNDLAEWLVANVLEPEAPDWQEVKIPAWEERRVFGMGDDGLNALLGSAHGSGLAWMMMQRRAVLGWKRVKGVTVWKDEEQPGLSMIFELEARGVGGVRR